MAKSSSWTSYAGMEIRLVVKGFSASGSNKASNAANSHNIYRDDEIKSLFQRQAHKGLKVGSSAMPEIGAKGSIDKGVVKVAHTW